MMNIYRFPETTNFYNINTYVLIYIKIKKKYSIFLDIVIMIYDSKAILLLKGTD